MTTTIIDQIIEDGQHPRVFLQFPDGGIGDFRLMDVPTRLEEGDEVFIDEKEIKCGITTMNFCGKLKFLGCKPLFNARRAFTGNVL